MKLTTTIITALVTFLLCGNTLATEGDIGPVYLEKVIIVALASGGHTAGNLEIQIKNNFTVPQGLNCNNTYITTLKSTDTDKRLYSLLLLAQSTKQPVHLRITDDPAYTAFYGRCSLVWGAIAQ
jgi:hypothetical protein